MRTALRALVLISLGGLAPACSDGGGATSPDDASAHVDGADAGASGLSAAPDGGGFCCPIEQPTCNCFRAGGWTASDDLRGCRSVCDMAPPAQYRIDDHGCQQMWSSHSCLERDTGVPPQPPDTGDACAAGGCADADAQSDAADAG
jgi:hypothetical protein